MANCQLSSSLENDGQMAKREESGESRDGNDDDWRHRGRDRAQLTRESDKEKLQAFSHAGKKARENLHTTPSCAD